MSVTIPKNSREQTVVRRREYRGRHFVDVRKFFQGADGEPRPTGKGVTVTIDRAGDLADAILTVVEEYMPREERERLKMIEAAERGAIRDRIGGNS